MTVIGSYAIRNNMLDVWVMFTFGIIGYVLQKLKYPTAPMVLGFILGPYIEDGLLQSLLVGRAAGGVITYMTTRPICLILIGLCLISVLWPVISGLRSGKHRSNSKKHVAISGLNTDLFMGITGLALASLIYLFTRNLSPLGGIFINYCLISLASLSIKPFRIRLGDKACGYRLDYFGRLPDPDLCHRLFVRECMFLFCL